MCMDCRAMVQNPPARDWRVISYRDRGAGHYYRYAVTVENLNWPEGHRDRVQHWSVPSLDDPRYDLSAAILEVV